MMRVLRHLVRDESGEDLIEYGLLVAFAAAVVTAVLITDPIGVKSALVVAFTKVRNALSS